MENNTSEKTISYLSFKLGNEEYGAHVSKILNILEMTKITKVPRAPEYMKGIINLRGMVLPVIDTRIKFGMTATEYTDNTCIVVMGLLLDGELVNVGALVDEVSAVIEITDKLIGPAPSIGQTYKSEFISGVANIDERFIMILDLIKVFSNDEILMLRDAHKSVCTENIA